MEVSFGYLVGENFFGVFHKKSRCPQYQRFLMEGLVLLDFD